MMSFGELLRALCDPMLRLRTVNRWALSKECEPWLQKSGAWLLDRVVRIPEATRLFGVAVESESDLWKNAGRSTIQSIASCDGRLWALAKDGDGLVTLVELSERGLVRSLSSDLGSIASTALGLELATFQGRLWVQATGSGHRDGFLYDLANERIFKVLKDELEPYPEVAFVDSRGPGYVQFGKSLVAHRFASSLGEYVEWRRRFLGWNLEGSFSRQLLEWGDGWLGILVQPSPWREGRWIHRVFSLDDRLALQGMTLPFTLDRDGQANCRALSWSPDGQRVWMASVETGGGEIFARTWTKEQISGALLPCSSGHLEFPSPAALKRLRYLGLKT